MVQSQGFSTSSLIQSCLKTAAQATENPMQIWSVVEQESWMNAISVLKTGLNKSRTTWMKNEFVYPFKVSDEGIIRSSFENQNGDLETNAGTDQEPYDLVFLYEQNQRRESELCRPPNSVIGVNLLQPLMRSHCHSEFAQARNDVL